MARSARVGARSAHGRKARGVWLAIVQAACAKPPRRSPRRRRRCCRRRESRSAIASNRGLTPSFYKDMTVKAQILKVFQQEDVNFLLTNRIPRRLATRFMGWFSRIEQPLVRDLSIVVWRLFSDLDLGEAKKTQFQSLHDCFIRELKGGIRPIEPNNDILISPCDAIVAACGKVAGTQVLQAKGFPYLLEDLLG